MKEKNKSKNELLITIIIYFSLPWLIAALIGLLIKG
jgi:hypothetical protein